ncbi:MAG: TIM barrel protein, partial [Acidobacteria bacterium]|nr:TIM barrel protein [Acidobacteriota bacterium]
MRFGLSTHLFHDRRLTLGDLREVSSHGFDRLELFATRSHFDYHDALAIADLAGWLHETGIALHSIHGPIVERHVDGQWMGPLSLAAASETARAHAVAETAVALEIARRIPAGFLVVHLGLPDDATGAGAENSLSAAVRSLEEVSALAAPLGVRVAVEVIPNRLSSAAALAHLLEDEVY